MKGFFFSRDALSNGISTGSCEIVTKFGLQQQNNKSLVTWHLGDKGVKIVKIT